MDADWFSPDAAETVVWRGKPRVRRIIPSVAGALVVSLLAVLVGWVLSGSETTLGALVAWSGVAVVVLLAAGWVGLAYLHVRATDYVLTDRNVYKKTGVLSERVTQVGLGRIQNTTPRTLRATSSITRRPNGSRWTPTDGAHRGETGRPRRVRAGTGRAVDAGRGAFGSPTDRLFVGCR